MRTACITANKLTIDPALIGGKGVPIHEMYKRGIPVPTSYSLGFDFFEEHLKNINFWQKVNIDGLNNKREVSKILQRARRVIVNSKISDVITLELDQFRDSSNFWAVRSSANIEDSYEKSWAGGFESFIGVDHTDLESKIKKVWASVFTERVLSYLERPSDIKNIKMAILLQHAIESDVSGVCFTQATLEDNEEMIIESVHGVGEYLVQGEVTPDRYIIDREKKIILEVHFNEQPKGLVFLNGALTKVPNKLRKEQKLEGRNIIELANLCFKVEKIYKNPRDIEWCLKDGIFYILQSRPITT